MKYVLEFEAPDDWKPIEDDGCWVYCPLKVLTRLGCVCKAKTCFDEYGEVICPIITIRKRD